MYPQHQPFLRHRGTSAPTVSADSADSADYNRAALAASGRLDAAKRVERATVAATTVYRELHELAGAVGDCILPEQRNKFGGVRVSSTRQTTYYWCVQYLLEAARQLHVVLGPGLLDSGDGDGGASGFRSALGHLIEGQVALHALRDPPVLIPTGSGVPFVHQELPHTECTFEDDAEGDEDDEEEEDNSDKDNEEEDEDDGGAAKKRPKRTQTTSTQAKKHAAATPLDKAYANFLAHLMDMRACFDSFVRHRRIKAEYAERAVRDAEEHLRVCTGLAEGGGRGVY